MSEQGTTTAPAPSGVSGDAPAPIQDAPNPQGKGAAKAGDVASAAAEAARKLKYKTDDGREEEVDEAEALKVYRERKKHQSVASRELNEGKRLTKEALEFVSKLKDKSTLKEALKTLGYDPRKLSEEILSEHLEDELMDPRDKELRDTKAKLKQIEELEKKQKEEADNRRKEEMKTRFMKEYEQDFVKALEESNLPPTKSMVAEMAKYISRSAKIGFKMSPVEAAKLVKEDILVAQQRLIGDADGDKLIALLGEQVANKIRKYDTAKLKDPGAALRTPEQRTTEPRERGVSRSTKRMTPAEWRAHKMGLK